MLTMTQVCPFNEWDVYMNLILVGLCVVECNCYTGRLPYITISQFVKLFIKTDTAVSTDVVTQTVVSTMVS